MRNNNFTVDGTIRSIAVTKQVSVFNGKILPTREASLTLVVDNDFNCIMSKCLSHLAR